MYTIYSIGDATYLTAVLNAVAMLSGSGSLKHLAGSGFLIGVVLVMFQGIIQARPPQLQNVLVAWVVYMAMFGPVTKVAVEDIYNGQVRVVDNVPLGPAFVGSAMSQIGYGTTRLFEQAFATPTMSEHGFLDALEAMSAVRKGTLSRWSTGAANSPTPGADMDRTFTNYMAECVLYETDIGQRSIDDLMRNPTWATLGPTTPMVVPTTELWLGGSPQTLPCNEAWPKFQTYISASFTPALKKSLAATLSLASTADLDAKLSSALLATGANQTDAENYMVMAAMQPYIAKGRAQALREIQQWNAAVMVEQGAQQRNTQWAGEERMFKRNVRPLMSFLEAVLFAVAPLMVFAIGLGPLGFGLVGRYLLFALWIQLWQPLMAVVNLFIMLSVQGKMSALQDAALGHLVFPSFAAMAKYDALLIDYLGTGGMLAASVPAVALMLLYGSAHTAVNLAGRLQGGDHLNEKVVSPDVVSPGVGLSMQALQDHGSVRGTAAPGAESVSWNANVGQDMQRELKSSQQASERASVGFGHALGTAAQLTASRSNDTFDQHADNWMKQSTVSATDKVLQQAGQGFSDKYQQKQISGEDMGAVLGTGLIASAGPNGGVASAQANIASRLENKYHVGHDLAAEMATDMATSLTSQHGLGVDVAEAIKTDAGTGERNVFTSGLTGTESSSLTRSADDVISSARSLDRAESMSERFGTLGSFNGVQTGAALAAPQNQVYMARMQRYIDRFGLGGDQQREEQRLLRGGATADPEQARGMAGMGLLLGHTDGDRVHSMSADERTAAKAAGMEILGEAFNFKTPQGISPGRHADLADAAPAFGSARAAVDGAGLRDVRPDAAGLQDQIADHRDVVANHGGGLPAVDQFANQGQARVDAFRSTAGDAVRHRNAQTIGGLIKNHAITPRSAAQVQENIIGGFATQVADTMSHTAVGMNAGLNSEMAGLKAFGTSLAHGEGLGAAIAAGKQASGSETSWAQAEQAIVNARMDQVRAYGLTPSQTELYRNATHTTTLAEMSPAGRTAARAPATEVARQAARQAVISEAGPDLGNHVADLIERSGSTRDDTDLVLIGAYNTHATDPDAGAAQKKTEPPVGGQPTSMLSSPIGGQTAATETSGFGMRVHPITGRSQFHAGEDLAAPVGTPLVAVADGVVTFAGPRGSYGNLVEVTHPGGLVTRYGHTSEMFVTPGQPVAAGEKIATVGSTGRSSGPHVHFETRMDGRPVDPAAVLGRHDSGAPPGAVGGVAQAHRAGGEQGALQAPAELREFFRGVEQRHGLPAGMLTAIASVESDFRTNEVSNAGAQGMFQITPKTAVDVGVSNPFDPREAAEGAAKKLARDHQKFGNWNYAVMAYNAGTQRIADYLAGDGKPLKQETLDYLPKVVDAFKRVDRIA